MVKYFRFFVEFLEIFRIFCDFTKNENVLNKVKGAKMQMWKWISNLLCWNLSWRKKWFVFTQHEQTIGCGSVFAMKQLHFDSLYSLVLHKLQGKSQNTIWHRKRNATTVLEFHISINWGSCYSNSVTTKLFHFCHKKCAILKIFSKDGVSQFLRFF